MLISTTAGRLAWRWSVVGSVAEPALTELIDGCILVLPKHTFTHPQYGTVMSMLDTELQCRLKAS